MISFAQPLWILAGAACCLLLVLLWSYFENKRNMQLQQFAAASLLKNLTANVSSRRRLIKKILLLGAVFCCFAALARPQYGYRWVDVKHKGIDILFALDTSKSMLVEDIRPNRLERSKLAIMDFVSQLSGDRVGLMPFAGSSYLICPLTADYYAFEQSLAAIDTAIIPTGGTDIGQAIESAEKILSNEANHKILVVITDGENLQGDVHAAAVTAHKQNMTIYTVGVGTGEGELIPDTVNGGFIKDSGGSFVKSRLDEKSLKTISKTTDGLYVPLGHQGQGLETIYQQKLALIPKTELAEKRKKLPIDRFEWILAVSILLLSIEYLLSGRKVDHRLPRLVSRITAGKRIVPLIIAPAIVSVFLSNATLLKASEGEEAYTAGDYLKAQEFYQVRLEKDPENPQLLYNSGTVAYRNNLLDEAVDKFEKTLATDDIHLQERAYYNLGNVHYRKGEEMLGGGDQQTTIKQWQRSLKAYQGALALNPDSEDALYNHDLVKTRLDQLKQQQQNSQEQQQDSQDQQDETEQSENDKGEQENQGQQDKQQQSSDQQENNNRSDEAESAQPENQTGEQQPEDQSESGDSAGKRQENSTDSPDKKDQADQHNQVADAEESSDNTSAGSQAAEADVQAMTREEAEQLLQAVQNEEGRLNLYVPMQKDNDKKIQKDW